MSDAFPLSCLLFEESFLKEPHVREEGREAFMFEEPLKSAEPCLAHFPSEPYLNSSFPSSACFSSTAVLLKISVKAELSLSFCFRWILPGLSFIFNF